VPPTTLGMIASRRLLASSARGGGTAQAGDALLDPGSSQWSAAPPLRRFRPARTIAANGVIVATEK